jgi:hypothetical protein
MRKLLKHSLLGVLACCTASITTAAEPTLDFIRDIQPIFKESCLECHDAKKHKADFRLDNRLDALRGGEGGASIVPGHAKDSLLMKRIRGEGEDDRMPVKKPPLTDAQIAKVGKWIDQGAAWPEAADGSVAKKEVHWSYTKPVKSPLPTVKQPGWVRNPIDAFIAARLEKEGLTPSPEAPPETLIRRLSLDLIGLPPTPAEVDSFLNDHSPQAYEKVVDRLLASPHYGERWARPWLDLARYADSNGFEKDRLRSMWPYRDWVITALNRNIGFDQFTIRQIAGDLLPGATIDDKIATGFHRNTTLNEEGGVDPEEYRYYAVVDRVNTTAAVWLGTTMGCCQCHNHKYDPFTMKDYYRLSAFFNSTKEETTKGGGTDPHDVSSRLTVESPDVKTLEAEMTALKEKLKPQLAGPTSKPAKDQIATLQKRIDLAKRFTSTLVMAELTTPRETHVHVRGGFLSLGETVSPNVPATVLPLPATRPTDPPRSRLDLATWLVSRDNPLTARVTVNRFWESYFGRGIVETSEDFGTQGSPPTHPQLLDWLAVEFMDRHWDMKAVHKLIVMSATYRQSSNASAIAIDKDPSNKYLSHGPRFRLEAELLRDQALLASGLLSEKQGGPSVFPSQPDGVWNTPYSGDRWIESDGEDRYRRGIYTFLKRSSPYPMFTTFDATSRELICTRRPRTDTPLQALTTLNDPAFIQPAAALGRLIVRDGGSSVREKAIFAFRRVLVRKPDASEVDRLIQLHDRELASYAKDKTQAISLANSGLGALPADVDAPDVAAWTIVSNVLLNLDETLTKG